MDLDELMKAVNESYEKNANVKIVFGEPIEKEGVTVIPVAKLRAKVGEGNTFHIRIGSPGYNENTRKEDSIKEPGEKKVEKLGYGIDAKITPMGFIEIKDGRAEFKQILDINRMAMGGLCFAGICVFLMTRMITRVARILIKNQNKCNCNCKDDKESCCCEQKKEK